MRDRTDKKDLSKGRLPRKNTLSFLHCPNWGWGTPLPKSILTRFQNWKSCQHCVQEGGGDLANKKRKVFFLSRLLKIDKMPERLRWKICTCLYKAALLRGTSDRLRRLWTSATWWWWPTFHNCHHQDRLHHHHHHHYYDEQHDCQRCSVLLMCKWN